MRKKIELRLCQLLHSSVSLSLLLFVIISIRCVSCVAHVHLLLGGQDSEFVIAIFVISRIELGRGV